MISYQNSTNREMRNSVKQLFKKISGARNLLILKCLTCVCVLIQKMSAMWKLNGLTDNCQRVGIFDELPFVESSYYRLASSINCPSTNIVVGLFAIWCKGRVWGSSSRHLPAFSSRLQRLYRLTPTSWPRNKYPRTIL